MPPPAARAAEKEHINRTDAAIYAMSVLATGCFAQMAQWAAKSGQMGSVAGGNIETAPPDIKYVYHLRPDPKHVKAKVVEMVGKIGAADQRIKRAPEIGRLAAIKNADDRAAYMRELNQHILDYFMQKSIDYQKGKDITNHAQQEIIQSWKTKYPNAQHGVINERDILDALNPEGGT